MKRETRHIPRTMKQRAEIDAVRNRYQQWKPSLKQLADDGDYEEPITMQTKLAMMRAAAHLKALRGKQRLSLGRLAQKSGMDKSMLSRLENGAYNNATLLTMNRYAIVLGEEVDFAFRKSTTTRTEPVGAAKRTRVTRGRAARVRKKKRPAIRATARKLSGTTRLSRDRVQRREESI